MALQTHSGIEAPVGFMMLGWGGVTSEDPIFAAVFVEDTDSEAEGFEEGGSPQAPVYSEPADEEAEEFVSDFTPYTPTYVEV